MLRDQVSIIRPYILQIYNELVTCLMVVGRKYDRIGVKNTFDIESTFDKDSIQGIIGNFSLDKVCSVKTIKTVCPHHSILKGYNFLLTHILYIVLKESIDRTNFLHQIVRSLKFLSFACEMEIIELIPQEIEVKLFNEPLEVNSELKLPALLFAQ